MAPTETLPDTPVMRQYSELKAKHPDSLLFFRLGDFFELFGEDAKEASRLLGLMLTQRQGVPMCGVPAHNAQNYIGRLLRAGRKIAMAEQLEEPSKAKKLVRRDVVRVVTPGTIVEDELLDPGAANALLAVALDGENWGAAGLDVSTGESWATQGAKDCELRHLHELISRTQPAEIVAASQDMEIISRLRLIPPGTCVTAATTTENTPPAWANNGVWRSHPLALKAALAARSYVDGAKFRLKEMPEPSLRDNRNEMSLDETAIRTLEIIESAGGPKRHSLWGLLDHCRTPMGSRALKARLLRPSTDPREIARRLGCVEDLLLRAETQGALRRLLEQISDLPRVAGRLSTRQAGPRDLGALRKSLAHLSEIEAATAKTTFESSLCQLVKELSETAAALAPLRELLAQSLADDPPARLSEGGLIREGWNQELDELRRLKTGSDQVLAELEARERRSTGLPVKAGYNSIFGYYLEITKSQSAKAPAHYVRKQTLTNAERYITPELKELEARILSAEHKMLRLEAQLFEQLRDTALQQDFVLLRLADLLAELDVLQALAQAAALHGFIKPLVDLSFDLEIEDGRHPVLAALLPAGSFVPNSLALNARDPQIMILTGPNMAGKSTYLRQNALIALMAQAGSFVPAKSARIGVIDKILTRIGAQDALARGDSTFMVEMKETSHILAAATPRSLVVLDEVGRGTSTFDGISIAWAVLEHLHKGPRTLFATHYLELTELAQRLPGVINANVQVKEWAQNGQTEVVFLHKIAPGPADRSYGLHVAALAGLPPSLVARAGQILAELEERKL